MKRRSLAARSNRALAHLKNGDALQAKLDCEEVQKTTRSREVQVPAGPSSGGIGQH